MFLVSISLATRGFRETYQRRIACDYVLHVTESVSLARNRTRDDVRRVYSSICHSWNWGSSFKIVLVVFSSIGYRRGEVDQPHRPLRGLVYILIPDPNLDKFRVPMRRTTTRVRAPSLETHGLSAPQKAQANHVSKHGV